MEMIGVSGAGSLTVWALYAAAGVDYAGAPFSTQRGAARLLGVAVALLAVTGILSPPGATEWQTAFADERDGRSALRSRSATGGSIPGPCGDGGLALRDVVAVTGTHDLRAKPSASAAKVRNEKASRTLRRDHFHQIDGSQNIQLLRVGTACRRPESVRNGGRAWKPRRRAPYRRIGTSVDRARGRLGDG